MSASQFILVYDSNRGRIVEHHELRDAEVAARRYAELERAHTGSVGVEVVMLSGDSLEALAATHGSYFRDSAFFLRELEGAAERG